MCVVCVMQVVWVNSSDTPRSGRGARRIPVSSF